MNCRIRGIYSLMIHHTVLVELQAANFETKIACGESLSIFIVDQLLSIQEHEASEAMPCTFVQDQIQ